MPRNRRGVGLPELLGAIAILALVTALLGAVTYSLMRMVSRISVAESANARGLLIQRDLERAMQEAQATAWTTCVGNTECVVLENHYEYQYDSIAGTVDLILHDPALTVRIAIENDALWVGAAAVEDGDFTIGAGSTLTVTETGGTATIVIAYRLVAADGSEYAYTATYAFQPSVTP